MQTIETQIHQPQILNVSASRAETSEGESKSNFLASVILGYGPLVIRAFLRNGTQGMYLSMPGHKGNDDKWWDEVYFRDRSVHEMFEEMAKRHYLAQRHQMAA